LGAARLGALVCPWCSAGSAAAGIARGADGVMAIANSGVGDPCLSGADVFLPDSGVSGVYGTRLVYRHDVPSGPYTATITLVATGATGAVFLQLFWDSHAS
jgi:hypothetical protein